MSRCCQKAQRAAACLEQQCAHAVRMGMLEVMVVGQEEASIPFLQDVPAPSSPMCFFCPFPSFSSSSDMLTFSHPHSCDFTRVLEKQSSALSPCCRQGAQSPGRVDFAEELQCVAVTSHLLEETYSLRLPHYWLSRDRGQ